MTVPIAPPRTWVLFAVAMGLSGILDVVVIHVLVQSVVPVLQLPADVVSISFAVATVVLSLSPLWRSIRLEDDQWSARMGWFGGVVVDPAMVASVERRDGQPLESWGNRLEDDGLHLIGRAEWPRTRWILTGSVPCRAGFKRGQCAVVEFTHPPELARAGDPQA